MYYLLENNRIIETKKEYGLEYITEYQFVYVKDLHYQGLQVLRNATTEETIGFIKKQSENVFELVETGDCYLYQNEQMARPEMCLINDKISLSIFNSRAKENPNSILAIYKPNEKGDYIKVWEKKDE